MNSEYNPYLKSPEELDIDFRDELRFDPVITQSFVNNEQNRTGDVKYGAENCDTGENDTGTGLNPKTEILTERDQDENKEKEQVSKKKIPL